MDQEILLALYTYNTYANRLVLDTVEQLTEETFSRLGQPLPTLDIIIPLVIQSGQEWPGPLLLS